MHGVVLGSLWGTIRRAGRVAFALALILAMVVATWRGVARQYARFASGSWSLAWGRATEEDAERKAFERTLGGDAAALAYALEAIPEDGLLAIRLGPDGTDVQRRRRIQAARCVLYPRLVAEERVLRGGLAEGRITLSPRIHVLDMDPAAPFELVERWDRVGDGVGWVLWRWRGDDESR